MTTRRITDSGPFVIVPLWVFDAAPGDRRAQVVAGWVVLARYANGDGQAWPSRKTLAAALGVSVSTWDRVIATLVDCGAVEVVAQTRADLAERAGLPDAADPAGQTSNLYRLHYDNPARDTRTPSPASLVPVPSVTHQTCSCDGTGWVEADPNRDGSTAVQPCPGDGGDGG